MGALCPKCTLHISRTPRPLKDKLLVILFFVGYRISFNIVGSISFAELLALFGLFVFGYRSLFNYKEVKTVVVLFVILELVKVFSELFVSNGFSSSLKGLAIPVFSVLNTFFLLKLFMRDEKNIWLGILVSSIAPLFFGTSFEEASSEEIMAGEAAAYLKFFLAPLVLAFLLFISQWHTTVIIIIYGLLGLVFVVLGARSSGGIAFIAATIAFVAIRRPKLMSPKRILIFMSCVALVLYPIYVVYVNRVLDGEITSGNSEQLLRSENPYNPIELLKQGRVDAWAAWQAFMDEPLLGHGAWAYDESRKYLFLELEITGEVYNPEKFKGKDFLVPSHSVIINQGSQNGILAFCAILAIFVYFTRLAILAFTRIPSKYALLMSARLISFWWVGLFSPPSHLRQTFPLLFATFLTLYLKYKDTNPSVK